MLTSKQARQYIEQLEVMRGKILRAWQGQHNERELIGQAASWARTVGKFNRVFFES